MSVDRDFKVGIEADASQAVQATKQVTDETERYEAALRKMAIAAKSAEQAQRRETVEKQAEAVKDVTAEVDKAEKASSSWKKALQAVGHEFPIIGSVGRLAMNPIVGAATAAAMAFGLARQALAEWNAEMDAAQSRNAEKDFMPGIEAKAEVVRKSIEDAAAWQRKLNEIAKDDSIARMYSNALAKLKEYIAGLAALTAAEKERALKRIEEAKRLGKMTPSQAAAETSRVEEEYRKKEDADKTAAENEQLRLMQKELEDRKKKEAELAAATEAARLRRQQIKEQYESAKAEEPGLKTTFNETDKKAQEFGAQLPPTHMEYIDDMPVPRSGPSPDDLERERQLIAAANVARQAWQSAKEKARLGELGLGAADDTLTSKQKEESDNREAIKRLEKEIEQTMQALEVRQGFRAKTSAVKSQTAEAEAFSNVANTEAGKEVASAAATADAILAGKEVSAQAKSQMQMLGRVLWGVFDLSQQQIELLSTYNDKFENLKSAVERVEAKMVSGQKSGRRD